ncbi:MAG: pseudouridine synthase [Candidatus Moranbacteria bacterium]|nr:pseudouridine synthase [Candidatus Moranbacteria bacterium]
MKATQSKFKGKREDTSYRPATKRKGNKRMNPVKKSSKAFVKEHADSKDITSSYERPEYAPKLKASYFPKQKKTVPSVFEAPVYPMRLNRHLAIKNFSSRREADRLIEKGLVTINGVTAKVGDKVKETDTVEVDGKLKQAWKKYRYFLYYKQAKIATHTSTIGQKSIRDVSGLPADVFPVGRLDRASHGLMIMTNDGRVTDKVLNPEYAHEKEYVVRVNKKVNTFFIRWMSEGIQLEDFKTKPCIVTAVDDQVFKIILTEGKKHQIRRMCTALGYEVRDLKRVRIMGLRIGLLKPGQYKELRGKALTEFLISIGIG